MFQLYIALGLVTAGGPADDEAFFESKVRPVLEAHCLSCHSAAKGKVKGGLALDTQSGWQTGGDSGPAIRPGQLEESLLINAVRYDDEAMRMPPKGKLAAHEIADLERWVKSGAFDPRRSPGKTPTASGVDLEQGKQFWSFRPVADPKPPAVADASWPAGDVDRFLLAAMEAKGIRPVADAPTEVLLRRVCYDLTGLPPSADDARALREHGYDALVDRLLASPAFGEKWGRHWLDVARYADSNGSSFNPPYRHAWKYRNWVIDAVNADVPYDQFLIRQIAGDLLPATDAAERDANIIASGYLMFGSKVLGQFDKPTLHLDVADEQIDSIGKGMLGLTLGCARCHDHKFDPVPTRDYYALAGIFTSTQTLDGRWDEPKADENDWNRRGLGPDGDAKYRAFDDKHRYEYVKAQTKRYAARDKLDKFRGDPAKANEAAKVAAEVAEWDRKIAELAAKLPPLAMAPQDAATPADERIRVRGVASSPGAVVPRGFLQVASFAGQPAVNPKQSGRLELALWIASADNPLTARVAVNRAWAHLFGEGIVRSLDNFGTRGDPPTHPELLDFLARRFSRGGWKWKDLVRDLVTSRAYRLSAADTAANDAADPENRLIWKHSRRRLTAEEIRDTMLSAAEQLDRSPGQSLIDHLPPRDLGGQDADAIAACQDDRRTVYQPVVRNLVADVQEVFDFANPSMSVSRRARTAVAPQALYLLNSPTVQRAAKRIAGHVAREAAAREPDALVTAAFRRIVARGPSAAERAALARYLRAQYEGPGTLTDHDVMKLCHVILAGTPYQFLD